MRRPWPAAELGRGARQREQCMLSPGEERDFGALEKLKGLRVAKEVGVGVEGEPESQRVGGEWIQGFMDLVKVWGFIL